MRGELELRVWSFITIDDDLLLTSAKYGKIQSLNYLQYSLLD